MATPALGISMGKGPGGLWTHRAGEPGNGRAVLPVGQGPTALGAWAGTGAPGMGRDRQGCRRPRTLALGQKLISICSSFTAALSLLLAVFWLRKGFHS